MKTQVTSNKPTDGSLVYSVIVSSDGGCVKLDVTSYAAAQELAPFVEADVVDMRVLF